MIHFVCFLSETLCSLFLCWRQQAITGLTAIANVPAFSVFTDKLTPPRIRVDWATAEMMLCNISSPISIKCKKVNRRNDADRVSNKTITTSV